MQYSVLIADDEMLARYSIRTLIARHFSDIQVVGEAENGRQAIEQARLHSPDIIFMDIKMPGVNGLEASKEILQSNPDTIIIILTAHDNFSYAQKALNEGVQSYLLKPFRKQQVIKILQEKITILENRNNAAPRDPELQSFMEEEYIALLIGDNTDRRVEEKLKKILQIKSDSGVFVFIGHPDFSQHDKHKARKILKLKFHCISSDRIGKSLVFFVPGESFNQIQEELEQQLQDYVKQLGKYFHTPIQCGMGSLARTREDMEKSFHEAALAYERADSNRLSVSLYQETVWEAAPEQYDYPLEDESEIVDKIHSRDYTRIDSLISAAADELTSIPHFETLREYSAQFLLSLRRTVQSMGVQESIGSKLFPISSLLQMQSAVEIKHAVISAAGEMIASLKALEVNPNWWLERAFLFIRKNLYSDISLDTIADNIQISPQHLSRIFKAKYSKTIGEYIKEQRISYAKYLLRNSDYSIKDICRKTGYSDQNYFSRVFKSVTGYQPTAYRDL